MNQINLVPIEYKKREKRKWYVIFGALAGALILMILITLALIPVFKISSAKKEQHKLTEALATKNMVETRMILDETEQAYLKNTKAAKLLGELDVPSHITRQTMDVIIGSVPKGLRMNLVTMEKSERAIVVEGYAKGVTKVAQYITQLYNTGQFEILEYEINSDLGEELLQWTEYKLKIRPTFFADFDAAEEVKAEEEAAEEAEGSEEDADEDVEEEEAEEVL